MVWCVSPVGPRGPAPPPTNRTALEAPENDHVENRTDLLTDDMLQRFDERARIYDRENRFFQEDWDELVASGYLKAALPTEYGGRGLGLREVSQLQRRLAYYAPATALGVNMHHYWIGMALTMRAHGDSSCDWMLEKAAEGHVFAAGHGESGNDLPLLLSTSKAERVDGGWEITGHKIFGSLSPVWTYLGLHAMDTSDPAAPKIVHAFLSRDAARYHIEDTWDTLGMRATMSNDTILDKAFVPDAQVPLVCPAGFAGAGPFQVGVFAWGLLGFGSVYSGIAHRTFDDASACALAYDSWLAIAYSTGGRGPLLVQPHAHEREELLEVDRLGDVVRRAGRDRLLAVALHRLRGQGDDREARANSRHRADRARRLVAVHLGHHHVHQDEVDAGVVVERLERLAPVLGEGTTIPRASSALVEREHVAHVVVDDQHRLPCSTASVVCSCSSTALVGGQRAGARCRNSAVSSSSRSGERASLTMIDSA